MPRSTGAIIKKRHGGKNNVFDLAGAVSPIDTQLQLLLQFIKNGEVTLNEIWVDFSLSQSNPEDLLSLQRATKRIAELCVDLDAWGFELPYRVAFGLQVLLVKSLNQPKSENFWELLNQGLALLSYLLDQCEIDYRQRLACDDMLDNLKRAACH